ncbi:unnamed protein product [Mytilus edulis]|uniref:Nose resistant-to-fluoxetine protein N-terminal domain-containing protein n=1 Tax=Mytilus edulis TaxID=6550 RepID=A0A8S3Q0Z0_MYTED|nr:unnamed protein product [Mytilus edulis]
MMETIERPKFSITPKEADDFIAGANDILSDNTTTNANGPSTLAQVQPLLCPQGNPLLEQTNRMIQQTTIYQTTVNTPTTNQPLVVSKLCRNQINATGEAISRRELWALAMVDAFGKPQSNILGSLGSPIMWIGDYDECMSIQANTERDQKKYTFKGQFCVASSNVNNIAVLNLGVCVPNSCSKTDVMILLKTTVLPTVYSVSCPEHDRPLDTRATIVLVVCSIFIAFLVIGTCYDVIAIQWPSWSKEEDDSKSSEIDENTHLINGQTQNTQDNTSQWLPDHLNRISFGPIYNAFPAVDTFFALSYHLVGVGIILAFLLGSTIACGVLSAHDDLPASIFDGRNCPSKQDKWDSKRNGHYGNNQQRDAYAPVKTPFDPLN